MNAELLATATGCEWRQALAFIDPINAAMIRWGVKSRTDIAAFLAMSAFETGGELPTDQSVRSKAFTKLRENMVYTTPERLPAVWPSRFRMPTPAEGRTDPLPDNKRNALVYANNPEKLANFVYGSRLGNRGEASGDGYKYLGRGLPHLTGLSNYQQYQQASGTDVVDNPEQLELDPFKAADCGAWFWHAHIGSAMSERANAVEISRAWVGGQSDSEPKRAALLNRITHALKDMP